MKISRKKLIVSDITSKKPMEGLSKRISDIVVYGKGLGGGYAISAVLGKSKIMEEAKNTFISSTMFTERIGFVAALKTIEILCENKVWEHLIKIGSIIGDGWLNIAKKYSLNLTTNEFKPLISFKLNYEIKQI